MTLLNVGCGPHAPLGWLNCDVLPAPGVALRADLCRGLPLATDSVEAIAAIHVLQDLAWDDVAPALTELHRVLEPGGALRLGLPDLDRAIRAYRAADRAWFHVPDRDARSSGAKLVTQIVWYGSARTPMNFEFVAEWMDAAGFASIARMEFGKSRVVGLAALDNRERESFFVEGVKGGGAAA